MRLLPTGLGCFALPPPLPARVSRGSLVRRSRYKPFKRFQARPRGHAAERRALGRHRGQGRLIHQRAAKGETSAGGPQGIRLPEEPRDEPTSSGRGRTQATPGTPDNASQTRHAHAHTHTPNHFHVHVHAMSASMFRHRVGAHDEDLRPPGHTTSAHRAVRHAHPPAHACLFHGTWGFRDVAFFRFASRRLSLLLRDS